MAGKRSYTDLWHVILFTLMLSILSVCSWGSFVGKAAERIGNLTLSRTEEASAKPVIAVQGTVDTEDGMMTVAPVGGVGGNALYAVFEGFDRLIDKAENAWQEGIFLKPELSRIDSLATYRTTGEIVSSQVLQGKEGWLFYESAQDGRSVSDYEGTDLYTEEEMQQVSSAVGDICETLEGRGIRFVMLVAPNKENVYPEYMPERYIHGEMSRSEQIVSYLAGEGIPIIYPIKELKSYSYGGLTAYYRYDSHWNQLGAYIGVRSALDLLDIKIPAPEEREIRQYDLKDHYHYCGTDDLARMVGLLSVFDDEIEIEIEGTVPMDWKTFELEQGEGSHYFNPDAAIPQTLLLVGDSFRSSMVPALREIYRDVWVYHRSVYRPEYLDEITPDVLIEEHVERYADGIKDIGYLVRDE